MRIPLRHRHSHLVVDVRQEGAAYQVVVDGTEHVAEALDLDDTNMVLAIDGRRYHVTIARNGGERLVAIAGEVYSFVADSAASAPNVATVVSPEVTAPMPGKVLQVLVRAGDRVESGDGLLLLEAMKMESRLTAEAAGTVAEIRVAPGDMVVGGQLLILLRYDGSELRL